MTLRPLPEIKAFERPAGLQFEAPAEIVARWTPGVRAAAEDDETTISVYETIGYDPWTGGGMTAKRMGGILRSVGERDVTVNINSPGGVITAGMSIYDTMQFIKPDVSTICMGQAASMGAFLLTAGAKGKRFCLPNSRVMIHQPLGGYQGQATDIEIHAREILKVKGRMNELMAHHTGQSLEQIERDTERDRFLSAAEAVEYGLVDSILTHRN